MNFRTFEAISGSDERSGLCGLYEPFHASVGALQQGRFTTIHTVPGQATVVLSMDTAVSHGFVVLLCRRWGVTTVYSMRINTASLAFIGGLLQEQFEYPCCFKWGFHGFELGYCSTSMDSWSLEVVVGFFESSFKGESVAPLVVFVSSLL